MNALQIHVHNGSGDLGVGALAPLKPNSSRLFTGRKDILDRLESYFATRITASGPMTRRFFLLYGMGGIGKTQICLKLTENMVTRYVLHSLKLFII